MHFYSRMQSDTAVQPFFYDAYNHSVIGGVNSNSAEVVVGDGVVLDCIILRGVNR